MKNQLKILIPLVKKLTYGNPILRVAIYSILILIASYFSICKLKKLSHNFQ
jgi:hypothetical protein